jgi:hypothetical protein
MKIPGALNVNFSELLDGKDIICSFEVINKAVSSWANRNHSYMVTHISIIIIIIVYLNLYTYNGY